MSEYRRKVVSMFSSGKQAREIAAALGRTVQAVNSALNYARRKGELERDDPEGRALRRRRGHWKAFAADMRPRGAA